MISSLPLIPLTALLPGALFTDLKRSCFHGFSASPLCAFGTEFAELRL
jgi:hypothetical protein